MRQPNIQILEQMKRHNTPIQPEAVPNNSVRIARWRRKHMLLSLDPTLRFRAELVPTRFTYELSPINHTDGQSVVYLNYGVGEA